MGIKLNQKKQEPKTAPTNGATTTRSQVIASKGIHTSEDLVNTMSALMSDMIDGSISPSVGNAVCNATGKLLKMVEMQYKYASTSKRASPKLTLT
jgi:hypothetical protein